MGFCSLWCSWSKEVLSAPQDTPTSSSTLCSATCAPLSQSRSTTIHTKHKWKIIVTSGIVKQRGKIPSKWRTAHTSTYSIVSARPPPHKKRSGKRARPSQGG